MTQVRHSFLHQNNSPANHVARFVSRARQFLWWNRAVFYCVHETCTRKKLVQDWPTHVQVFCTSFSPALVHWHTKIWQITMIKLWYQLCGAASLTSWSPASVVYWAVNCRLAEKASCFWQLTMLLRLLTFSSRTSSPSQLPANQPSIAHDYTKSLLNFCQ